ncbi:hypothetical protein P3T36_007104 [Kitasatospora sp. MAP12-15]|uniref:hypothetical protein n=1 Tax=unclassified Kitasatospora TaxID=2633591 RepID=UPI0024771BC5|nr:hypothetical protein [Kitasatospora sp. MAP12-44]MDH6108167.1 hypothetical protein [Kitasatospora sp. MAP12-44]
MTAPPMTTPETLLPPARRSLAARLPLLGLYPAKYRAAYGEEIAAVFAETVQDSGPRTALREWAALAAHAGRLRTRLSSSDPAGRITAGAAPFILAGGAGLSVLQLLVGLFLPDPLKHVQQVWHPGTWTSLVVAQTGPWILALILASLGRWTPARLLVLLGILGRIGAMLAFATPDDPLADVLPYDLLLPFGIVPGTVLLIAPADAVDISPHGRGETVLTALALAVPMSVLAIFWFRPDLSPATAPFSSTEVDLLDVTVAWPAAVMSLAMLLHLGARRPDRLRATGIALAVLPWTAVLPPASYYLLPPPGLWVQVISYYFLRNTGVVLAFLATATLLAYLRHTLLHRSLPTDPPETT